MLEHLRRIVQDELRSPSLSEAVISRVEADTQAVLYFFFTNDSPLPALVAKASSDPEKNRELRSECEHLMGIHARLPESLRSSVPRVRGSGEWRGHFYFLQDFIHGKMAGSVIRGGLFGARRAGTLAEIERAWEWLMALQSAPPAQRREVAELGLRALLDAYAAAHAPSDREAKHLADLAAEIESRGSARVPAVLCHGDFFPGNVLLGRGAIAVIDWRYFRPAYHPCFDAMLYVSTLRPSPARGESIDFEEDLRRLLFAKHWTNGFFRSLFGTFLAKHGIDEGLFSFLCAMTLLEMSVREYSSSGAVGDKDAVWRERFLCFMENRDRMLVCTGPREQGARRSDG
jgi:hypothetical protein